MAKRVATSRNARSARPDAPKRKRDARLKSASPTPVEAVRGRLLQHIDAAAGRLQSRRRITDEDVHEARKSIKRARAALRLLQPALDANATQRSRVALRDAGRALASARDAKVLADRFAEMLQRVDIEPFAVSTIAVPAATESSRAVARGSSRSCSNPAAARAGLLDARQWLANAAFMSTGWAALAEGLRTIYRSGRRDVPTDADAASSDALHEWRKRVKRYLHALEALSGPRPPPQVRRAISSARRLADALGEEHDLALLADSLRASDQADDVRVARLLGGIAVRRRRQRSRAFKVGKDLFAVAPAAMVQRLRSALR